jgi:hypothetical protein
MKVFRDSRWPGYASVAWLVAFAVSHIVLAIFPGDDPTGDGPWGYTAYIVYDLVLVGMSIVGAVVASATVRPWGRALPRWTVLTSLWIGSVLLIVRGIPGMAENVLTVTGIAPHGLLGTINGVAADHSTMEFWSGMAINTYFFLGAVVLVPATVSYARQSRVA